MLKTSGNPLKNLNISRVSSSSANPKTVQNARKTDFWAMHHHKVVVLVFIRPLRLCIPILKRIEGCGPYPAPPASHLLVFRRVLTRLPVRLPKCGSICSKERYVNRMGGCLMSRLKIRYRKLCFLTFLEPELFKKTTHNF